MCVTYSVHTENKFDYMHRRLWSGFFCCQHSVRPLLFKFLFGTAVGDGCTFIVIVPHEHEIYNSRAKCYVIHIDKRNSFHIAVKCFGDLVAFSFCCGCCCRHHFSLPVRIMKWNICYVANCNLNYFHISGTLFFFPFLSSFTHFAPMHRSASPTMKMNVT